MRKALSIINKSRNQRRNGRERQKPGGKKAIGQSKSEKNLVLQKGEEKSVAGR